MTLVIVLMLCFSYLLIATGHLHIKVNSMVGLTIGPTYYHLRIV